jgi:hypothetical protein
MVRSPVGTRGFSLLNAQTDSGGQHSLVYSGYWELLSCGYSGRGVKLSTQLHLVPRPSMVELYFHSPIHLHGIVLN